MIDTLIKARPRRLIWKQYNTDAVRGWTDCNALKKQSWFEHCERKCLCIVVFICSVLCTLLQFELKMLFFVLQLYFEVLFYYSFKDVLYVVTFITHSSLSRLSACAST